MRGKKFYDEKRAPSSFYGVRGKKDDVEEGNNDNYDLYTQLLNDRAKLEEFLDDYFESRNFEGEKVKRQPSGFVGMRGKKSVNNDDYFEYEKRAPMGFQGVRGKKSEFPDYIGSEDKRAPLGGFFGMRGKKQPFVSLFNFLLIAQLLMALAFRATSRASLAFARSRTCSTQSLWAFEAKRWAKFFRNKTFEINFEKLFYHL